MPKTIAEELIEAQGKIAALEGEGVKTLALITEKDKAIVDLQASVKTLTDEKSGLVSAHEVALSEVTGKLTAETAAHAETVKSLDEAKKKLADPAYKMASAPGDGKAIEEGGAVADKVELTQAQALAEYRKLDGKPEDQKAYRVKNWRVLGCAEEK